MDNDYFKQIRKSLIVPERIYFWTATIHEWQQLLKEEDYKKVILESLKYLVEKGKIEIFAFVIMPNHVHFIWRINEQNGKETTVGSFLKYTAHEFKKLLSVEGKRRLEEYAVEATNKSFEFWRRDSLAIELISSEVAYQKLEYIHNNPCTKHWQLVVQPFDYKYATARFYEEGVGEFDFVKDLRDEFD
ncbi:MAG: putative transposase [Marivirga sp.]|jgi:putative transposase